MELRPHALRFVDVLAAFVLFLMASLLAAPAIAYLLVEVNEITKLDPETEGWLNVVSIVASSTTVIAYSCIVTPFVKLGIWRYEAFKSFLRSLRDLLIGASSWFVAYPVMLVFGQLTAIVIQHFFAPSPVDQVAVRFLKQTMGYPTLFTVTVILIVFVVPCVEEILFRGLVQTWLRRYLSVSAAISIASLIFALFHFSTSQGANNGELLVSLFVLACFLGFVYERQQSLWASIGLHSIFNGVSVLALTIQ